jgi:hypothetical protein
LPRTRTLTTCHFYVLKSKEFSKETGKETKMNYYIQNTTLSLLSLFSLFFAW